MTTTTKKCWNPRTEHLRNLVVKYQKKFLRSENPCLPEIEDDVTENEAWAMAVFALGEKTRIPESWTRLACAYMRHRARRLRPQIEKSRELRRKREGKVYRNGKEIFERDDFRSIRLLESDDDCLFNTKLTLGNMKTIAIMAEEGCPIKAIHEAVGNHVSYSTINNVLKGRTHELEYGEVKELLEL